MLNATDGVATWTLPTAPAGLMIADVFEGLRATPLVDTFSESMRLLLDDAGLRRPVPSGVMFKGVQRHGVLCEERRRLRDGAGREGAATCEAGGATSSGGGSTAPTTCSRRCSASVPRNPSSIVGAGGRERTAKPRDRARRRREPLRHPLGALRPRLDPAGRTIPHSSPRSASRSAPGRARRSPSCCCCRPPPSWRASS